MKMSVFKGAAVAICTPFFANGDVDYDKFREQIEYQIENGTDAIVVCGTTLYDCVLFCQHCMSGCVCAGFRSGLYRLFPAELGMFFRPDLKPAHTQPDIQ